MKDKILELKNNLNTLNQSLTEMENTDYESMTIKNKLIFLNKISDSATEAMDYTRQFNEYSVQYNLPEDILINLHEEKLDLVKEYVIIKAKIDSLENPQKSMYKNMGMNKLYSNNDEINYTICSIKYYISLLIAHVNVIELL